jgi:lysophospholipase L1-like esterase
MSSAKTYLALGDSMSIDDYTGVKGGGAVSQFFRTLGHGWSLDDRTTDGCQMAGVPRDGRGDLITLTIGGNDLLWNREEYLNEGIDSFQREHAELLGEIRQANPQAMLIVGDIYEPALPLSAAERRGLAAANAAIHGNCEQVQAIVAPIHHAFQGRSHTFLCLGIEPTLQGATAIAKLFEAAYRQQGRQF